MRCAWLVLDMLIVGYYKWGGCVVAFARVKSRIDILKKEIRMLQVSRVILIETV